MQTSDKDNSTDGVSEVQLHEFKCGRCGMIFIAAEGVDRKTKPKCPECGSLKLTRVVSVYASVELIAETEDVTSEPRAVGS